MTRYACVASISLILLAGSVHQDRMSHRVPVVTNATIEEAITRGVNFLAATQLETGEFPVEDFNPSTDASQIRSTPLGTALLLWALPAVPGDMIKTLTARGAHFLESRKLPGDVWRYHDPIAGEPVIPSDTGDTGVSAVALLLHSREPGTTLETLAPYADGHGRFLTWPRDPTTQPLATLSPGVSSTLESVDCVINTQLLGLAAIRGVSLPSVCMWVVDVVRTNTVEQCSTFYPPTWLGYAVTKARELGATCVTPALPTLREQLERTQREDGSWGNVVETAVSLSTAISVGVPKPRQVRAVTALLAQQGRDGSWPREPAYAVNRRDASGWQHGSASLTTGVVLEALSRFLAHQSTLKE